MRPPLFVDFCLCDGSHVAQDVFNGGMSVFGLLARLRHSVSCGCIGGVQGDSHGHFVFGDVDSVLVLRHVGVISLMFVLIECTVGKKTVVQSCHFVFYSFDVYLMMFLTLSSMLASSSSFWLAFPEVALLESNLTGLGTVRGRLRAGDWTPGR